MDRETKNQKAWETLFKRRRISRDLENQQFHIISARDIGDQREARLMTKFDRSDALPKILIEEDCVPLSISRSQYALIRPIKPLYKRIDAIRTAPIQIAINEWREKIRTMPWGQVLKSESQAIDLAYLMPILKPFFGEEQELWATIRGRSTLKADVPIRFLSPESKLVTFPFNAKGVQVEFDAGYESQSSVYLVEAKINVPDDINIRQFYFPYWYWTKYLESISFHKPVRLIFLAYSGHVYYLYEFGFEDPTVINSLKTIRSEQYVLGEREFSWQDIARILKQTKPVAELSVPFPQADELERVVNVVEIIQIAEDATADDLAENYEFTDRQGDYYANAARWLGWLRKSGNTWRITTEGDRLTRSNDLHEMAAEIFRSLCQRPVTRNAVEAMIKVQEVPSVEFIQRLIEKAVGSQSIKRIADSTVHRRAQTIHVWLTRLKQYIK